MYMYMHLKKMYMHLKKKKWHKYSEKFRFHWNRFENIRAWTDNKNTCVSVSQITQINVYETNHRYVITNCTDIYKTLIFLYNIRKIK